MIDKLKELYFKYEEIVNYLIAGVLAAMVSLAVKYGLLFTILDPKNEIHVQIAVFLSWFIACTFAYFTNRKFVFKSKSEKIAKEMAKFMGGRVATLGLEALCMWFFINFLGMNSKIEVFIWTLVTQALVMIGNYVLSKLFVFKKEDKS
ncbi:MAG: GtrA family protein [Clostridia bacterium]|nr:GtrA family protein [Clostridia bacterium]